MAIWHPRQSRDKIAIGTSKQSSVSLVPTRIGVGCNTKAARERHRQPDKASGCAGALAKAFPEIEFTAEAADHHRQQASCFAGTRRALQELKDDLRP